MVRPGGQGTFAATQHSLFLHLIVDYDQASLLGRLELLLVAHETGFDIDDWIRDAPQHAAILLFSPSALHLLDKDLPLLWLTPWLL